MRGHHATVETRMIGIWQAACAALASVLATAAVAWFSFGNETVTQEEMVAFVAKEIHVERLLLKQTTDSLDRLSGKLDLFVTEQSEYRTQQAETNGKLSALVDELRKRRMGGT